MNLSQNNLVGLTALQDSAAYEALNPEERQVLNRYSELQQGGTLNGQTVRNISGIQDPELGRQYGGAGTVQEAAAALLTDGVEIEFFIRQRPYLFFASPENGEFYFFRNTNPLELNNFDMEVLEVSSGQWVHVDHPDEFFGNPDVNPKSYPGLVKAHFVVTQFQKDSSLRDRIQLHVEEESLEPKNRGELYYHEREMNGLCQLHAANAFLGYPAIRPNAFAEYMVHHAQEFNLENVEGLQAGGQVLEATAAGLGDGTDLGHTVGYMRHLAAENELRVNIDNLQQGELNYSEKRGLVFNNFETGETHKVDAEFLARNSRVIVGTFQPAHATAARKNTDDSWSNIDSFNSNQKVHEDFVGALTEKVNFQKTMVNSHIALPCAFA